MTASELVAALRDLKPRFLEGLAAPELKTIVAAAKQRRFLANSIITSQGDSAGQLFLLLQGRARYFYLTQEGQKVLLRWAPAGEIFGGIALPAIPSIYLASTETVKNSCVLAWEQLL